MRQRKEVIRAITESFTLRELAQRLGESSSKIYPDLHCLVESGEVIVVDRRASGRRGRPESIYQVAKEPQSETAWVGRVREGAEKLCERRGWLISELLEVLDLQNGNSGRVRAVLLILEAQGSVLRVVDSVRMPVREPANADPMWSWRASSRIGRSRGWWTSQPEEMAYQRQLVADIEGYMQRRRAGLPGYALPEKDTTNKPDV